MSGSSLMRALDNHDRVETERLLLTQPSEVSMRDSEDRVALHYAAETMELDMFKKIFEQDPTLLDCEDKNGHTPLLMAVMGGRIDLIEFLISKGADINHCDRDGHSAVHWAVVCGEKATPLHYATASEEIAPETALSILHVLLKHGAKPNSRDVDERTPILWAASNGNLEAMHSLRQAGGDLKAVDRDSLGVIHCAASHGYHETVDFIMEALPHYFVDQKDRAGHTALFYAVTYGHYEVAKRLLDYGANPNHQDHRLRTPSHCAAAKGQMRMLKLLKQYNASFEIQNYRGDLPVHEAVQSGSKDVVEWLLALQPSSLNAGSHEGRTCLHLAAAQGNLEMVIMLCTKGCYVDPLMLYKNNLYTPLDLARRKDHQLVVDYLSTKHRAKRAEEIPEEERQKNRLSFEEQLVQAKLARGRHLLDEDEENEALMKKSKAKRRRSSGSQQLEHKMMDTGVMTSPRRISSAGSRSPGRLIKSTSTSDLQKLEKARATADEKMEQIIREEIHKVAMAKLELNTKQLQPPKESSKEMMSNTNTSVERSSDEKVTDKEEKERTAHEYPEIDEEFEDLPAISDTSDEDYDEDNQRLLESVELTEASSLDENGKRPKENVVYKTVIIKKGQSADKPNKAENRKAGMRMNPNKKRTANDGKLVRVKGEKKERKNEVDPHTLLRVQRLYDAGEYDGNYEVFEDEWEEIGANRTVGKDASRRYIHEKAIFQELTHLKRMQIQYGKVQERILVRSLVGNFCKMHGLDPANFKFQTFYAWEKFLYDQLKLIYMEERQRLSQARGVPITRPLAIDRFETRIRQARAVPLRDENIERMTRVYQSSMANGKSVRQKEKSVMSGDEMLCRRANYLLWACCGPEPLRQVAIHLMRIAGVTSLAVMNAGHCNSTHQPRIVTYLVAPAV
ncbi:unnamed protein product [Cylicocyclus nassatus]|uniref:ANK_REP_REGION domain-containing protein n=1 Tax=Cylicocyclus nassatus TaxID=53992 RepID=A0AA36DN35_CYLNA|nr:unnamed protein product [Cylicocyclus nassatus]